MGTVTSKCVGDAEGVGVEDCGSGQEGDKEPLISKDDVRRRSSSRPSSSVNTVHCPTCQGTGWIPRGQESKLVAVIPCNDQRLKPRHTKLYVLLSVALCLLASSLVLFFLFPRSVTLSPVSVKSSLVNFTNDSVNVNITNVLNITNNNFVRVQTHNLTVQALNIDVVVGTISIKNVTIVEPLSSKMYTFMVPITLTDLGLYNYCRSSKYRVHTLFLHLQMALKVYYLARYEQLSMDAYEYIDCGSNNTLPHSLQLPPT
ncbi:transmembrane protein 106B-like [Thalassophryne amazonica]|uniref:transmembrane protein 106B-like n=1 Tax=Thalassophryne amazonica TaxID=390379 RepID=UPI001471F1E3|nr:transmembrane protein 106B-like [Thalassophryne amazonica]